MNQPLILGIDDRPKPTGFWRADGSWHALFQPDRMPDEPALPATKEPEPQKTIEICRSFSYKLNLAKFGRDYESADFFCSRKITCAEESAPAVSEALFEECVQEIRDSMQTFVDSITTKRARRPQSAEVATR